MPILKWTEIYATGLPLMDRQHREFFRRINLFHDAVISGESREAVGGTLRFLAEYTVLHFHEEEEHMERAGYPALPAHRHLHEKLARKVHGLLDQYDNGQMLMTTEVSQFIADWLTQHIREHDMAYVPWLKAKGLGQVLLKS